MTEKLSWFQRLKQGLTKSSSRLTEGLAAILVKRKLDQDTLDEIEELLIAADLGPGTASKLTSDLGKSRFGKEVTDDEVRTFLADEIATMLAPVALPLDPSPAKPFVVLVVGVNGVGKTTTIGKLAEHYRGQGKRVMMAAGDTFRAAAVAQLVIWGERTGTPVVQKGEGADPAALAYEALERARREDIDVLLIDTAGRLHNKAGLMEELAKVVRVLQKQDPAAPHSTLLVLDATTGQNAINQVETFRSLVQVNGLVVTKLDGSAKGGVLVALAEKFKLPVHAIGVGETAQDLQPFDPQDFARSLMGVTGEAA
ncbi:MAG TPA: signal recognition particle-docking protein FtsY [Alphaproteobacteria bacterium]|jgi:fused signal recognition particle receptor|nr:signal recognition particle-docking protein FtsY [Alphaproteobacteria bacterium]